MLHDSDSSKDQFFQPRPAEGVNAGPDFYQHDKNPLSLSEKIMTYISIGSAATSLAFQQSPGNELARGYIGLSALEATGSPAVAAVAVGLSTFAIEGATGLSVASAFRRFSGNIHGYKDRFFAKFHRLKKHEDLYDSSTFLSDSILSLTVGSSAVVARRHLANKSRNLLQDTKTVLGSSSGIAVASSAIAYAGLKSLDGSKNSSFASVVEKITELGTDWRSYLAIAGLWGATKLIKRNRAKKFNTDQLDIERLVSNSELVDIDTETGLVSVRIDDLSSKEAEHVLNFEQRIWDQKGYGSLGDYNKYLAQTRLFACFKDGKCVGATRIFTNGNSDQPAPFISEMHYYMSEEKDRIQAGFARGEIDELGTTSFANLSDLRGSVRNLWRLAYRDAAQRGVKAWGIIMEPNRVRAMSRLNKFTFTQLGESIDYQGGDCAPHVMYFDDYIEAIGKIDPSLKHWFVDEDLKK